MIDLIYNHELFRHCGVPWGLDQRLRFDTGSDDRPYGERRYANSYDFPQGFGGDYLDLITYGNGYGDSLEGLRGDGHGHSLGGGLI